MPRVIYIAGYGRSGSTLLSILLDNLTNIASVGEVAGFYEYLGVSGRECSCNNKYFECPVWSNIINDLPRGIDYVKEMYEIQTEVERWNKISKIVKNKKEMKKYSVKMAKFFDTIADDRKVKTIVDSSKSSYSFMWRALALSNVKNVELYLVHLVRDAKGVVASRKKGKNSTLERKQSNTASLWNSAVGLAGWLTSNLAVKYTKQYLDDDQSTTIEYRELVQSPEQEAQKIIKGASVEQLYDKNDIIKTKSLDVGHLVGGNRLARNNQKISIETDNLYSNELSNVEEFLCKVFAEIVNI